MVSVVRIHLDGDFDMFARSATSLGEAHIVYAKHNTVCEKVATSFCVRFANNDVLAMLEMMFATKVAK